MSAWEWTTSDVWRVIGNNASEPHQRQKVTKGPDWRRRCDAHMKTVPHTRMSALPCLSGRGLRRSSKGGRDWLEARVVPLPATGGPGQIRSAPLPALFPFSAACVALGHLKPSQGWRGAVQAGGLKRTLSYNGVNEAEGVWGRGVGE